MFIYPADMHLAIMFQGISKNISITSLPGLNCSQQQREGMQSVTFA